MEEVIGLRGEGNGSLKDFGVSYRQVDLLEDGSPDFETISEAARVRKSYISSARAAIPCANRFPLMSSAA